MPRRTLLIFFQLLLALGLLSFAFQNCGEVRVAPGEDTQVASSRPQPIASEFCAGTPGADVMRLQNFFFVNLTTKADGNRLLADSDLDGVPDAVEDANQALGFNKSDAYSTGVLDGICWSQGGADCIPASCDRSPLTPGITVCDATAYSSTTQLTGVDTDKDGLPDVLEILRGLDPIRPILDEDGDLLADGGKSNIDEVQRGTDASSPGADIDLSLRVSVSAVKQSDKGNCQNQDRYSFKANNFPLLDVEAYTHPVFTDLSHDKNENVLMAVIVSKPLDATKKGKIFYQIIKVQKPSGAASVTMSPDKFQLLGEFMP